MEKIKSYVEELFIEAPKSKVIREIKEELLCDLNEKYSDLIKEGISEKTAYSEVISSIGNIDELIKMHHNEHPVNNRKKTAVVVSISVGLYFFALIATVLFEELQINTELSGLVFLGICAIPTCILIYHFMSLPKYNKIDDSMVEEFKEWKHSKEQNKEIRKSISSILWTLILVIYFVISFTFQIWYISWVIFIIGGLIENIISLIMKLGEK